MTKEQISSVFKTEMKLCTTAYSANAVSCTVLENMQKLLGIIVVYAQSAEASAITWQSTTRQLCTNSFQVQMLSLLFNFREVFQLTHCQKYLSCLKGSDVDQAQDPVLIGWVQDHIKIDDREYLREELY